MLILLLTALVSTSHGRMYPPADWRDHISDEMLDKYSGRSMHRKYSSANFQGDIAGLASDADEDDGLALNNYITEDIRHWPNGKVPYVISDMFKDPDRDMEWKLINVSMSQISAATGGCITFVPRKRERDHIAIQRGRSCSSPVGRQGGKQIVSLTRGGCLEDIGSVQHELMHALGFYHEISRADRDQYIWIFHNNIRQEYRRDFKLEPNGETFDLPYDYQSIMHYAWNAFAKNLSAPTIVPKKPGKFRIGQNDGLSRLDIMRLNRAYSCDGEVELIGSTRATARRFVSTTTSKLKFITVSPTTTPLWLNPEASDDTDSSTEESVPEIPASDVTVQQLNRTSLYGAHLETNWVAVFENAAGTARDCEDMCRMRENDCFLSEFQKSTRKCRGYDSAISGLIIPNRQGDYTTSGVRSATLTILSHWQVGGFDDEIVYRNNAITGKILGWNQEQCWGMCVVWPSCVAATLTTSTQRCRLFDSTADLKPRPNLDTITMLLTNSLRSLPESSATIVATTAVPASGTKPGRMEHPTLIGFRLSAPKTSRVFVAVADDRNSCHDKCRQSEPCFLAVYRSVNRMCIGYDFYVSGSLDYDTDYTLLGAASGTTTRNAGLEIVAEEMLTPKGDPIAVKGVTWSEELCTALCVVWPSCGVASMDVAAGEGRCRLYAGGGTSRTDWRRNADVVSTVLSSLKPDRLEAVKVTLRTKLLIGEKLLPDERLYSPKRDYYLVMTSRTGLTIWREWDDSRHGATSMKNQTAWYAYIDSDGVLGLYGPTGVLWTFPYPESVSAERIRQVAYFGVSDDAELGAYTSSGESVWSTRLPLNADDNGEKWSKFSGCFHNLALLSEPNTIILNQAVADADACHLQCRRRSQCKLAGFSPASMECELYNATVGKIIAVRNDQLCVKGKRDLVRHDGAVFGGSDIFYHNRSMGEWLIASSPGLAMNEGNCLKLCYLNDACRVATYNKVTTVCQLKRAGGLVRYDVDFSSVVFTSRGDDTVDISTDENGRTKSLRPTSVAKFANGGISVIGGS